MPTYATISPTFSSTEATLEAINSASFYAESAAIGKLTGTKKHRATLAHFERIFIFIVDPKSSKAASLYSFVIACAAFVSCFMLFLQTLDGPNHASTFPDYPGLPNESDYFVSDLVFTLVFTIELLVRMAIWPSFWKEHEYLTERRLKPFLRDIFNWFDVAAIIPFYSDLLLGKDKSFVLMRLCRLLRIFKLARNHSGTYILLRAIRASLAPISIALIFFMEIVVFFSVVMYTVDPNLDRHKNGFSDLLTTGYFVVVTVATIGYGDITPTKGNMPGRLFSVMIIMSGTLFLSMPLAIIGTEFDRAWKEHTESVQKYQELTGNGLGGNGGGPVTADLAAAGDADREKKHEVLVKYNAPSRLYLRVAGLTGEASLMVQALFSEVSALEFSVTRVLEVAEDLRRQLQSCYAKREALGTLVKDMVMVEVEQMVEKPTFKKWLFVTLSDPSSSLAAKCFAKWIRYCQIGSMIIVVFQTMPDLQTYGEATYLCEYVVERYCTKATGVTPLLDPGCFRVDEPLLPIRFGCTDEEKPKDPSCFGYGLNYGSANVLGLTCDNDTTLVSKVSATAETFNDGTTASYYKGDLSLVNPFRLDSALSVADRKISVCKKWECDNLHVTFFEFGDVYVALEYLFTLTYMVELASTLYVCPDYRAFFKNPVIALEFLSFVPFFVFEGRRFFVSGAAAPIYVIPPGSNDFLTFLRLLRLSRIFKIQQSIPVTKVLWESISKTSTRLTIPYFMLMVVTTIFSFIMYELEKGQECFYGQECIVNGKNMTFPPELVGSKPNKRFLVNLKGNLSTFDDFFSAFWFVIVTIATIGYGDMEPVSPSGKLVAVAAMIFGACYTAMPLTLVGSQFNKSYREHKRREALLRTKVEVSKPFAIPKSDFVAWDEFARNEAVAKMQEVVESELVPVLLVMQDEKVIDEAKKARVVNAINELKDVIYTERVCSLGYLGYMNLLIENGVCACTDG